MLGVHKTQKERVWNLTQMPAWDRSFCTKNTAISYKKWHCSLCFNLKLKLIFLKTCFYLCLYVSAGTSGHIPVSVCCMCPGAHRGQKTLTPLELQLWVVMSHLTGVLKQNSSHLEQQHARLTAEPAPQPPSPH